MIRRILTATILIALTLTAIFFFPFPLFLLYLEIFLLLGLQELLKLLTHYGADPYIPTYGWVALLPWVWCYYPDLAFPYVLLAVLFVILWSIPNTEIMGKCFPSVSANVLGILYLGLPISIAASYHPLSPQSFQAPEQVYELMLILLTLWVSDSSAFFVGRSLGRKKVTPLISPNKSLEGFVAGVLGPIIFTVAYGLVFLPQKTVLFLLAAGGVLGVVGIMGDLFESILKRGAGVKDTSQLFPGHGGILDRIDSLLLAVPAYHLLTLTL